MKKSIALVLSIVMLLVLAVGCTQTPAATSNAPATSTAPVESTAPATSAPAQEVTITYQTVSATDMFTKGFAEYQKTHPNVKLEVQASDAQQYNAKVIAEAQTKTMPDVMWWQAKQYVGAESTGAFLETTDLINTQFKDRFVDGTFSMAKSSDGKIFCLPCEMQIQGFLVNTALFQKYNVAIPQTFDDLLAAAKTFKDNGVTLFGNGTKDQWPTWGWYHWFELWGVNENKDAIYKDHSMKFADSDAATALKKMIELYNAGAFPVDDSTITYEQTKTLFLDQKCAMMTTSTDWLTGIVGSDLDKAGSIQYNFGATFADSKYDQNTCVKMMGNGYGIRADITDEKKAILLDYFDWFYGNGGANIAILDGLVLPVKFDVTATITPLTQSILDLTLKTTRTGIITTDYAAYDMWGDNVDIWLESGQYLATMVNGCIDGSISSSDLPDALAHYDGLIDNAIKAYAALK